MRAAIPHSDKKKPADQKADGLKEPNEADELVYLPLTFSRYAAINLI